MNTYLLTLSYDGTAYHGWQRQKGVRTVQECVEDALCRLTGQPTTVTASGRTDEGVHALGQAASFACDTGIPPEKFAEALNTCLPPDVRALSCKIVPNGFCARRCAKKKTYVYRMYVSDSPVPHADRFALRLPRMPNAPLLAEACRRIEGTHDFSAFYCLGSSAKTTVRTVYSCSFAEYPAMGIMPPACELRICGNGFLYKMVRLLAGALLRLSDGKITIEDFCAALNGDGTRVQKIPAPSKALTLASVEYESDFC
ncbi:MAG: tRNA pseudouridine(38-40) synthase TruA [Clostridiales bacterium]|nr:tRNA pseudouridine(38-40) synthase TruA [Clostridiales bacterium]